MRCDQHMGLTAAAKSVVESASCEPSMNFYQGMFDDEYPLHRYVFSDGRVLVEAVQAEPWSSGPCFFLALKDKNDEWVKESLWRNEEIERT